MSSTIIFYTRRDIFNNRPYIALHIIKYGNCKNISEYLALTVSFVTTHGSGS
jgi:hypothetical protein